MSVWDQPRSRRSNLLLASISDASQLLPTPAPPFQCPAQPQSPPRLQYSCRGAAVDLALLASGVPASACPSLPGLPSSAAACLPEALRLRNPHTLAGRGAQLMELGSSAGAVLQLQGRGHSALATQVQFLLHAIRAGGELLQQPVDCGEGQLATRIRDSAVGPKIAFLANVHARASAQVAWVKRHLPRPLHQLRRLGSGGAHASGREAKRREAQDASAAAAAELEAQRLVALGLAAERGRRPREAAVHFEAAAALRPADGDILSRWSKQVSDCTYTDGMSPAEDAAANKRAVEIALRAVAAAPTSVMGHVASCVGRGRLALTTSDNKTKLALARDAQSDAEAALRLDSRSDLAHHLMGRWHYEMAGINFVCRTLVRMLYGAALFPGTYQGALQHFVTARQLAPERLIHAVELGRTLHRLGDHRGALGQLEGALAMDEEDINAHLSRREAEMLVRQLRRHHARALTEPGPDLMAHVKPLQL